MSRLRLTLKRNSNIYIYWFSCLGDICVRFHVLDLPIDRRLELQLHIQYEIQVPHSRDGRFYVEFPVNILVISKQVVGFLHLTAQSGKVWTHNVISRQF
ncbi:hypothetical protein Plhal304r1_c064g0151121 [Plasmopara halstedii]